MSDAHGYHEDPVELAHAETLGHEHRDIPVKQLNQGLSAMMVFLGIGLAGGLGAMYALGLLLSRGVLVERPIDYTPTPMPAGPILQSNVTAKTDIADLRLEEQKLIDKGGVDATTGKKVIPLNEALSDVARDGLPGGNGQ